MKQKLIYCLILALGIFTGHYFTKIDCDHREDVIMATLIQSNMELIKARTELKVLNDNHLIKTEGKEYELVQAGNGLEVPPPPKDLSEVPYEELN